MQRIDLSIFAFTAFKKAFEECKGNMAYYFKKREPTLWTFHPNLVFERFDQFLNRVLTIQVLLI